MKKYFILLFVLCFNLFGYEYLIYSNDINNNKKFFIDPQGNLKIKFIYSNEDYFYEFNDPSQTVYTYLSTIKFGNSSQNFTYTTNSQFMEWLKTDLNFLNDFYLQKTNYILNYFYNDQTFSNSNYIHYENYELLYNSDGLAVESVLNGSWAGLYDGPDHSGYLYDENGDLKYINGVSPSFFEIIYNKLMRRFGINLQSIFIKKIFYPLLILIFACVVLRTVIRLVFKAFLIRFYDKKIGQLEKRREKIENA